MTDAFKPPNDIEAAIHIATLRGLYGDLGESLDDPGQRDQLLAQIETAHGWLGKLLGGPAAESRDLM